MHPGEPSRALGVPSSPPAPPPAPDLASRLRAAVRSLEEAAAAHGARAAGVFVVRRSGELESVGADCASTAPGSLLLIDMIEAMLAGQAWEGLRFLGPDRLAGLDLVASLGGVDLAGRGLLLLPLRPEVDVLLGYAVLVVAPRLVDVGEQALGELRDAAAVTGRTVRRLVEEEDGVARDLAVRASRAVARRARGVTSLHEVLQEAAEAVAELFAFDRVRFREHVERGEPREARAGDPVTLDSPDDRAELRALVDRLVAKACERREAVVLARSDHQTSVGAVEQAAGKRLLRRARLDRIVVVPTTVGPEVVGHLVMARSVGAPPGGDAETDVLVDLGQDLGQAVVGARILEQEREARKQLDVLDRYRSGFVATVAHELRSPLSVLVGHLELLADGPAEDVASSLDAATRAAGRMTELVEDLLVLARLQSVEHRSDDVVVDLRDLVAAALEEATLAARLRHITVHAVLTDVAVPVEGSAFGLARVAGNLLSNAVKYGRRGGRVDVRLVVRDRTALLEVADDGLGMSETDVERAFEEFFRSESDQVRARAGSGLGLAIVRRAVEAAGGTVSVRSAPGAGSTFAVQLPVREPGA